MFAHLPLQCFTLPGYGRSEVRGSNGKVTYSAVQCPVGTFNVGRNTGGCQRCASGLTTAGVGAGAASECSKCSLFSIAVLTRTAAVAADVACKVAIEAPLSSIYVFMHCMMASMLCAGDSLAKLSTDL